MHTTDLSPEDRTVAESCRLFKGCNEQDVRRFLEESGVTVRCFTGGEIIPADARINCWSIVLHGSVRIYSGKDSGSALLINVIGPGDPFDIASLAGCTDRPAMSEAKTAGKCRIAFVGDMDALRLTSDYPAVAANCMAFFCERIRFLNRKLHTLSRGTAEQKLADFLLGEFRAEDGRATVTVKSCVELAVRLNLSRASLYRALGILEDSGRISRRGKQIELLDIPGLQNV